MVRKSLKSFVPFVFLLITAGYFPATPALAASIDFTDPLFSDCYTHTSCVKTVGGIMVRIEGWTDADPKDGVFDPLVDTPAPLYWKSVDAHGYHDGFGVNTGELDEIERPEFLVVRFLNADDPGTPGNWHYVKHRLSGLNITNLFNENGYLERGAYLFTVNGDEEDWVAFLADTGQVPDTTNGVLALPVPTPPHSDELADFITFTAPEPGYTIPPGQNHEFSLASLEGQALYTLSVSRFGTGSGTITSIPSGINCGLVCTKSYDSGTDVALTATPDTGSTFSGWTGDCDASGHVTVDADKSCTATFVINKTTPTITWANPADIVFGTALSGTQLNATASVAGTFVYTPPAGTVLSQGAGQTLHAAFTPTDTDHYNGDSKDVTINVSAATHPDLIVSSLSTTSTVISAGKTFSLKNTVKNQGTGAAGSFVIAFHLSTDTTFGNGDDIAMTATRSVSALAAGASSTASTILTIPSTTPFGTYYFCAMVDSANTVAESDETNNTFCPGVGGTIQVTQPDLIVSALSTASIVILPGKTFPLSNTVKNQGTGAAGSFVIAFHLSTDTTFGNGDDIALTKTRSVSSLAAGASSTGSTTLTIPSTTPFGTYYYCAMVDSANTVAESDETNNTFCPGAGGTIQVGKSDLIETSVIPNAPTVNQGALLSLTDTVLNQGPAGTGGSFRIAFYLQPTSVGANVTIKTPRVVAGDVRQPSALLAGASSTETTSLLIPANTPPDTYYVCAKADSLNQVGETDETNNTLCSSTPVTVPLPDLIISPITIPVATVPKGTSFPLYFTVTNQGGSKAAAFVTAFHLSNDPDYGGSDDFPINTSLSLPSLLSGGRALPTIGPVSSFNKFLVLVIPSTTPSGTYYVCGMADVGLKITELDETNNTNCSDTTITVP